MAKVKRKQIEYEGTSEQYVKGDGSLDSHGDIVYCVFTANEEPSSDETTITGTLDIPVESIMELLSVGKEVICQYTYTVAANQTYTINLFTKNQWIRGTSRKSGSVYFSSYYDNKQYTISAPSRGATVLTIAQQTINGEPIDFGKSINLQDGFYFPNATCDFDGNWYRAVIIGNQVWLAENLKTTHYIDGTPIPYGGNNHSRTNPYYYHPNNDVNNDKVYGLLYNLEAAIQQSLLVGWHVPSATELDILHEYVIRQRRYCTNDFGDGSAKAYSSNQYWLTSETEQTPGNNQQSNNTTGFNAIPAGSFYTNRDVGSFFCMWSSSKQTINAIPGAICHYFGNNTKRVDTIHRLNADGGYSIRCVSDLNPVQFRNWYIQQYGSLQHHLPEEVQVQSDWDQTDNTAPDFIKGKPTIPPPFFYGYTNTAESTPTKVVTLAEPTTGFKNGTYIMVYFAGGDVPAGNSNAISIGNDVYYLAYKAQGITQAGIINQGDKVLLWCHNGFAHVISNDRWSLPTITAADEGKILKVVNGALALVTP